MPKSKKGRGLACIPDYVLKGLSAEQKKLLKEDGHGLSFPCVSGCQMRFIRNGENHGGFFSYKQFGGVEKAINAAINRNRLLSARFSEVQKSVSDFVYLVERLDKRKNKTEWRYQVNYSKAGKIACKAFSMGHTQPSVEKLVHTYLTARLFRFYFDELGPDFDERAFTSWKTIRLYQPGCIPFDWDLVGD